MKKDNESPFDAGSYDKGIRCVLPYYEEFYNQVISVVNGKFENQPIWWLDIGCGTGKMASVALDRCNAHLENFTCSDPSEAMLEKCRERFQEERFEFIQGKAQELKLDYQYQVITAIQSLHYSSREERMEAVHRCFEALSEGGVFISFENFAPFSEEGKTLSLKRWASYQESQGRSREVVQDHIARYGKDYFPITVAEHLEVLHRCGFQNAEILWLSNMQVGVMGIK